MIYLLIIVYWLMLTVAIHGALRTPHAPFANRGIRERLTQG